VNLKSLLDLNEFLQGFQKIIKLALVAFLNWKWITSVNLVLRIIKMICFL